MTRRATVQRVQGAAVETFLHTPPSRPRGAGFITPRRRVRPALLVELARNIPVLLIGAGATVAFLHMVGLL